MKKQFKKILALILVILFITLTPISVYFNVQNTVYATETILDGIGKKVTATILASAGVLGFIANDIGIDKFYDGMIEFSEDVQNIFDLPSKLFQIGYAAITTSTKMKLTEVKSTILDYYNYVRHQIILEEQNYLPPLIPDPIAVIQTYNVGSMNDIIKYTSNMNDGTLIDTFDLTNGYKLELRGRYYKKSVYIESIIKYGSSVLAYTLNFMDRSNNWSGDEDIILISTTSFNNLNLSVQTEMLDKTNNITYSHTNGIEYSLEIFDFLDKIILKRYVDIPIAKSVPINLTLPWDLDINTEDVLGLDIDSLLEVINNLQLEEYLDRLLDLPKSITDAMYPPIISVEDGIISGVTDTTWDDVLAEGKEHTTILEKIADRIDLLINKIDDFFNPEKNPPGGDNDNGTDWGNFKNFFDIFWIFYYLIIIAILILLKFFSVIMTILSIPANTALFDQYPTMLSGLNYIKNIKVGGFDVTLQTIFEYMFTVFFFLYIATTLQKLYHSFQGIERQQIRANEKEARIERYSSESHYQPNNYNAGINYASSHETDKNKFLDNVPASGLNDNDYENIKFTGWGD